jgi:hypothetical protein
MLPSFGSVIPDYRMADQMSKSFRRVCLRDFDGVVDKYHKESERPKGYNAVHEFTVCVNDTLDAMSEEVQLLGMNLVALGYYLKLLYCTICVVCNFLVEEEAKLETAEYVAMFHFFAENVLQRLDAGDEDISSMCATIMLEFFKIIPSSHLTWFTPHAYE